MTTHFIKTVTTAPALLSLPATHSGSDVIIQNNGPADLFLGSSSVTTTNYGFKVVAGSAISLRLGGKDDIYGITASSTSVSVLVVGLA